MSSSLTHILNTGRSSLIAHQQAIANATNNTSNLSTPGFSKRDTHLYSVSGENGVQAATLRRRADQYLDTQIFRQAADLGSAEAQINSLSAIGQLYTEGEGRVGNTIDAFFNAIRNLSAAPTDLDHRRAVLSSAEEMTQSFSSTSERLTGERHGTDMIVDGLVDRVNGITKSIATLNQQISQKPKDDPGSAALHDRQEVLVRELSEIIKISTFSDDGKQITVLFDGGQPLVQGKQSSTLQATPDPNYSDLRRVDLVNVSGAVTDITTQLDQGKLGGILQLRDSTLTSLIDRLDQLASDIGTQVNTIHQAGFGTDGITGRNLFVDNGGIVAGSAASFAIDASMINNPEGLAAATTSAGAIGGNDNLFALQNLEDAPLAGLSTRTFAEEVADMVSQVGGVSQANRILLERSSISLGNLESLRSSQVGVSVDEEMIDLMKFQRAYQAGSKVIQTVNQMYNQLFEIV